MSNFFLNNSLTLIVDMLPKNVLVVVKQTPYHVYSQLKTQGKAPVALVGELLPHDI